VLAGLCVLAGCSSPIGHPSRGANRARGANAAAAITVLEAGILLEDLGRQNNLANARRDTTLLANYEAEGSFRIDAAGYRVKNALDPHHQLPSAAFTFTDARFHIPAGTNVPQWFLVDAACGRSGPRCALVLSRDPDTPWKLVLFAMESIPVPPTASADNSIIAAAGDADGLLASPEEVARAHAAYLTAGRSAPEAGMFVEDSRSREIIDDAELRATLVFADTRTGRIGPAQTFTRQVTVEPYPVRALKTVDGGAVAAYTTRVQIVAEQPGGVTVLKPDSTDAALAGTTTFHTRITITILDQWIVAIPPKDQGQVTVLAHTGGKESIA
jgi:hypothetical protein